MIEGGFDDLRDVVLFELAFRVGFCIQAGWLLGVGFDTSSGWRSYYYLAKEYREHSDEVLSTWKWFKNVPNQHNDQDHFISKNNSPCR